MVLSPLPQTGCPGAVRTAEEACSPRVGVELVSTPTPLEPAVQRREVVEARARLWEPGLALAPTCQARQEKVCDLALCSLLLQEVVGGFGGLQHRPLGLLHPHPWILVPLVVSGC